MRTFRYLALLAACVSGCDGLLVEPFGGSTMEVTFFDGVPAPAPADTVPAFGTPPADTFLSFYAVTLQYERDDGGEVVVDDAGQPVVTGSYAFHLTDFEITPVIDTQSPCFIEVSNTRFPGLHVTLVGAKLREVTGISDPLAAPPDARYEDIVDVLNADRRMANLPALERSVKAVTSVATARYPAVGERCVEDGGPADVIPPIECTGEDSNQVRLSLCQAFWAENPGVYEGNDKIMTVPLNGEWHGAVNGINPLNSGVVGGAGFFVDQVLTGIDSLMINWQYKDYDGDGEPDYPADVPDHARSSIGYLFMQGTPVSRTRGTFNVPMVNPSVPRISADAVVFPDLDQDQVNF